MRLSLCTVLLGLALPAVSQNLQLHYDFRHSFDPELNAVNYPSFTFEYFTQVDSGRLGSFLLKLQADLHGEHNNVGQAYTQVSQSLKFWEPKYFISLSYSGGLGVTRDAYGYYISNAYSLGAAHPFSWHGALLATVLQFRYNAFEKPSFDPQFTFYLWKGLFQYKLSVSGSFVFWTQNKDLGIEYTRGLHGKKFAFFGDPQIWVKIIGKVSVGSRLNLFYHVLTGDNTVQFYPTLGAKVEF